MNWIDALLALIIILALWTGWQRGFINGALGLFTWAGSFTAGYFLYPLAATFIERFTSALGVWVQAVAFIGTVIIARIFLDLLTGVLIRETTRETQQHPVNKAFGLVPGFINGLIQAIIVAALLLTMPFRNSVSDKARESRLAAAFAPPAFWLEQELTPIFSEPLRHLLPKPTKPVAEESVKLPFTVTDPIIREDLETTMLQLLNEERAKEGLKPLKTDPQMQAVARAHSKDMFAKGYFAHVNRTGKDPFDRMHAAGVTYVTAGENLALAQSLPKAHNGLIKSPGHRANILQPRFGRVGIGVLDGGIYGLMITQDFRN